uniref:Uncharacterized protein n=1 Tax=Parascaris equorum TaxID=6256 RepID=A0A914R5B0_PAREQ
MAADAMVLLSSIRLHVTLPPFSEEELRRIICVKYGRVAAVARKLIVIFDEHVTDLADNIAILGELSDVWALHCASFDDLMQLSQIISKQLSVSREQLEYYLNLQCRASQSLSLLEVVPIMGSLGMKFVGTPDIWQNKRSLLGVTRDKCLKAGRYADFASIMSEIARRAIMMPSKADWHPRWASVLVRAERLKQA